MNVRYGPSKCPIGWRARVCAWALWGALWGCSACSLPHILTGQARLNSRCFLPFAAPCPDTLRRQRSASTLRHRFHPRGNMRYLRCMPGEQDFTLPRNPLDLNQGNEADTCPSTREPTAWSMRRRLRQPRRDIRACPSSEKPYCTPRRSCVHGVWHWPLD
jgi:hypothetical protein